MSNSSSFVIAVASDLHFGELPTAYGPLQDRDSARILRDMLRIESPNLVVLNGDLITGEDVLADAPTKSLPGLFEPMIASNTKWASTYGNHDSKYNLSREALFQAESVYPLSLTQHGPDGTDGVTNYYLPLHASSHSTAPLAILWFLDSRGGSDQASNLDNIPNWVSQGTVTWFLESSLNLELQFGEKLQHLVFVHIPPLPFYEAQLRFDENSTFLFPGQDEEYSLGVQSQSAISGNVYDGRDGPLIDALLMRQVHSVWSGHDHGASWCSTYPAADERVDNSAAQRPFLCFCKHTGIGGYGVWQRGVRMMSITQKNGHLNVDTWVRMDDGSKVSHVSLNETYGVDRYIAFNSTAYDSEFMSRLRATNDGHATD